MTVSHSSSEMLKMSRSRRTPALLTSTSSEPYSETAVSTSVSRGVPLRHVAGSGRGLTTGTGDLLDDGVRTVLVVVVDDDGRTGGGQGEGLGAAESLPAPVTRRRGRRDAAIVMVRVSDLRRVRRPGWRRARSSCAVAPPRVSSSCLDQRKYRGQRVVDVDADAAVHVLRRVRHPVTALAGPPLRDRRLVAAGQAGVEQPDGLQRRQPHRLDVDVGVGQPVPDGLEGRDRAAELLASGRVLRRHLQRPPADTQRGRGEAGHGAVEEPPEDLGPAVGAGEDVVRGNGDVGELELGLRLAVGRRLRRSVTPAAVGLDEHDDDGPAVGIGRRHQDAPGRRQPQTYARSSSGR